MSSPPDVAVIGAGPAGLTAAYELSKHGIPATVFEKSNQVGGISRTETYKGYRFDIGGHRFFTKVGEVEALWHDILDEDEFLTRPRLSRIYYDGKFYPYPLQLLTTLKNLGVVESLRIMLSYLKAKITPHGQEENLEEWVSNRFGWRLYETFFKTYTEKVWGIPCTQIRADWAAQRIKSLSLKRAILNALFEFSNETTLIEEFKYPKTGPGLMWERCTEKVERRGGTVNFQREVVSVRREESRIAGLRIRKEDGTEYDVEADQYINSMPITHLIRRMDPPAPVPVREAAERLSYRDFLIVTLVIDQEDMFPDNWIYIHSPEVKVGRVQNFKNWSPHMVPDLSKTCVGMEYFCTEGDGLWTMDRDALIELATDELATIGLVDPADVTDGTIIRQPMAYPVYDGTYRKHVKVIRDYLETIENLQTAGRAGMHRYNNQDHSMLTAMLAAKNILGEEHNHWDVNVERSYHEDFTVEEKEKKEKVLSREQTNGDGSAVPANFSHASS